MTDDDLKALVDEGKLISAESIAEDLIAIQPMPAIDFVELAKHPLWQSFAERHFKR